MSYVVPTKDMQLKVSHFVDHTGKIYNDYLALWNYSGGSTILGLISACREAFGQLPPVFSKVVNTPSSTSTSADRQLVRACFLQLCILYFLMGFHLVYDQQFGTLYVLCPSVLSLARNSLILKFS